MNFSEIQWSGVSVGYLSPLSIDSATEFRHETFREMTHGNRFLIIASEYETIAGGVQLALVARESGLHRAEVQKLLVHTGFRRCGISVSLMSSIEDAVREMKRSPLVLDTQQGSAAQKLYAKCGYTKAGAIQQYARSADGSLHGMVFYYRLL